MADQTSGRIESLNAAARTLLENNIGAEIDAFGQVREDEESAPRNLADAADPSNIIDIGLTIVASTRPSEWICGALAARGLAPIAVPLPLGGAI